jgi:hypothetical protein
LAHSRPIDVMGFAQASGHHEPRAFGKLKQKI